jgi:PiT family inorganic phosphate transporter
MGVGAAERARRVRWEVAIEITLAWIITIPATALLAAALYLVLGRG